MVKNFDFETLPQGQSLISLIEVDFLCEILEDLCINEVARNNGQAEEV